MRGTTPRALCSLATNPAMGEMAPKTDLRFRTYTAGGVFSSLWHCNRVLSNPPPILSGCFILGDQPRDNISEFHGHEPVATLVLFLFFNLIYFYTAHSD